MPLGNRTRSAIQLDGRRCHKCKKVAKVKIDGEYLCRIHSPTRQGFMTVIVKDTDKKDKEKKKIFT